MGTDGVSGKVHPILNRVGIRITVELQCFKITFKTEKSSKMGGIIQTGEELILAGFLIVLYRAPAPHYCKADWVYGVEGNPCL